MKNGSDPAGCDQRPLVVPIASSDPYCETCQNTTHYAVAPFLSCVGHPHLRSETPKEGVQAAESLFFLDSWLFLWPLVGMTAHFLARGGVPHRRRQAVEKCFGLDALPRSAWRVEDAALHRRGVTIDGSPRRYLCVRCWKPHILRRCGALIYEMAFSD